MIDGIDLLGGDEGPTPDQHGPEQHDGQKQQHAGTTHRDTLHESIGLLMVTYEARNTGQIISRNG